MGKRLPPYAKRIGIGNYMSWSLDWGERGPHFHHHSTRHRPGALKPIRKKVKATGGAFFSVLRKRLARTARGFLRGFGRGFKNVQIRMMNPLDDEKRIPGD